MSLPKWTEKLRIERGWWTDDFASFSRVYFGMLDIGTYHLNGHTGDWEWVMSFDQMLVYGQTKTEAETIDAIKHATVEALTHLTQAMTNDNASKEEGGGCSR